MTKIKFMLALISIFAYLGGALAFKAKKFGIVFCTLDDTPVTTGSVLPMGACLNSTPSTTTYDPRINFINATPLENPLDPDYCKKVTCPAFRLINN